jgi:hypothetical protein
MFAERHPAIAAPTDASRPIFQLNTPKVELAINLKTTVTFIATSDRIKVLFVAVHEAGFGTLLP